MVRRAACRRREHGGGLPEVVDADRGWRDDAENFRIAAPTVVESVDGAAGNAERIARRDVEAEWKAELGARDFSRLKTLLLRVWESPLIRSAPRGPSKPARVT